jgi:hypothetical protein
MEMIDIYKLKVNYIQSTTELLLRIVIGEGVSKSINKLKPLDK